jgi:hypothetical protein
MAITTDCVDKGYSWLLDAVATLRIPLQWLTARNVDELANREGHGLPASEIAARMRELLHDGRIAVTWPLISGGERVLLTGQELVEVLMHRSDTPLYYGLTETGGLLWESVFHPAWDSYVDASELPDVLTAKSPATDRVEIAALTRELVEEYAERVYRRADLSKQVVVGSESWQYLQPWQATYWKTLPAGWRVQFLVTESDTRKHFRLTEAQEAEFLQTETFLRRIQGWRHAITSGNVR